MMVSALILAAMALAVGGLYGFIAGYENGYLKCREDVAKGNYE